MIASAFLELLGVGDQHGQAQDAGDRHVALLETVVAELDDVVADRRRDVGDLDRERAAQVILDLEAAVGLLGDALDDLPNTFAGARVAAGT